VHSVRSALQHGVDKIYHLSGNCAPALRAGDARQVVFLVLDLSLAVRV
jgi:hypothetical protein